MANPAGEAEGCNHKFEPLNEAQIFCVRCGEFRVAPGGPPQWALPNVYPCCHQYHCWCGGHHLYHPYTSLTPNTWVRKDGISWSPTFSNGSTTGASNG